MPGVSKSTNGFDTLCLHGAKFQNIQLGSLTRQIKRVTGTCSFFIDLRAYPRLKRDHQRSVQLHTKNQRCARCVFLRTQNERSRPINGPFAKHDANDTQTGCRAQSRGRCHRHYCEPLTLTALDLSIRAIQPTNQVARPPRAPLLTKEHKQSNSRPRLVGKATRNAAIAP